MLLEKGLRDLWELEKFPQAAMLRWVLVSLWADQVISELSRRLLLVLSPRLFCLLESQMLLEWWAETKK